MLVGGGHAARTPRFFADPERRLAWVRAAACLGLVGGLLIMRGLWLSSRFLPQTPVFPGFPATPSPLDVALLAITCGLLCWAAFARRFSYALVASLALLAFLLLQDQSRLFPSVYEYGFILLALTVHAFSRAKDPEAPLRTARLIVAVIYVWSGIQKLAPGFADSIFPALIRPVMPFFSAHPGALRLLAGTAPLFEIAVGLGLLTRRYRSKALLGALAMHVFLFFAIGPFWNPWEVGAWGWSLGTAILTIILFSGAEGDDWKNIVFQKGRLHVAAAVLFGMMPALNLFGLWDSALAFNVFSGNFTKGTFYLSRPLVERLPPEAQAYVMYDQDGRAVLDVIGLNFAETTEGLYAEPRIFRQIEKKLCAYATRPDDAVLILQKRSNLLGTPAPERYDCGSP